MKVSIGWGWPLILSIIAYRARGWDGVLAILFLGAFYGLVVYPVMVSHIRNKHK